MKVLLLQDVKKLGKAGDIVEVSDGYAKNFIIPKKLGREATKQVQNEWQQKKGSEANRKEQERLQAIALVAELKDKVVVLKEKAGKDGRLFGSVTSLMIQEELAKLGYNIERKRIEVATHTIKQVGMYSARIHLYENASSVIKLDVVSEAEQKAAERAAAKAAKEAEEAAAKAAKEAAEAAAAAEAAEAQAPAEEEAVEAPATAEEN